QALDTISRLSDRPVRTNFLLLGEPGTGKEGLARAIHDLVAGGGPLAKAHVLGMSPARQRAELFDRRSGALARAARGGMLLIDELCALDGEVQRDLLTALRASGAPRVIAISDRDARAAVASGELRHDLYFRIARIVLTLPPLRERLEDIPAAAIWMGNRILREHGIAAEMRLADDPAPAAPGDVVLSTEAAQ